LNLILLFHSSGFKCEWGCVKEGMLWVGGLGKEWTTSTGELVNHNPQFVKSISSAGAVTHWDWKSNYNKMAQALGIHFPGKLN
jgi:soluble calcium-activated nucleotidase 1